MEHKLSCGFVVARIWVVEGAAHQNLYLYSPEEYEKRVLAFLVRFLKPNA